MSKRAKFPLHLHKATDQWRCKLRVLPTGQIKTFYFGQDKEKALAKYLAEEDTLQAGGVPGKPVEGQTVSDVCNAFQAAKRAFVESGESSERSWTDYRRTCKTITSVFSREPLAKTLLQADFAKLQSHLATTVSPDAKHGGRKVVRRGPVSMANEVGRIRTVFQLASDAGLIPTPLAFGPDFRKPSRKVMRVAKSGESRPCPLHALRRQHFTPLAGAPTESSEVRCPRGRPGSRESLPDRPSSAGSSRPGRRASSPGVRIRGRGDRSAE